MVGRVAQQLRTELILILPNRGLTETFRALGYYINSTTFFLFNKGLALFGVRLFLSLHVNVILLFPTAG